MKQTETLREQAALLRNLAAGFDISSIKEDLLNLAGRCDQLADKAAREISDPLARPISEISGKASSA